MTKKNYAIEIFMCTVLILLPFLHVNVGLNVADQGYNLMNFESFPDMNQTWMLATLVANLLGKTFTYLPFGHYMLGMNIYCTLLLSAVTIIMYIVLKKDYNRYAVFVGLIIAICFSWAPKVTLYQYLSYYLFGCGALLLIQGLVKEKRKYMYLAGIVLGINMFVRFPNILQTSLIVVVIVSGVIYKKTFKKVCIDILNCIAGWISIVIPTILIIDLVCGRGAYSEMVHSLFSMTEKATSYTPLAMIRAMYSGYLEQFKWFFLFILEAVIGTVIYGFLRKKWHRIAASIIIMLGFFFILRVYWYWGVMNVKYTTYQSVTVWGTCFLLLSIIVLLHVLFSKNYTQIKRLYATAGLITICITPLGSNNALFSNYNNLYFLAPIVVGSLVDFITINYQKEKARQQKRWYFSAIPSGLISGMLVMVVLFQTFMFHTFFVFGDAGIDGQRKVTVEGNKILTGIYTTEENARQLGELTTFFEECEGKEIECIVWSHSPIVYYMLELDCAIGHTWPMLDSYTYDEFIKDIEQLQEYPIVIYEAQYYSDLLEDEEAPDQKTQIIKEMLVDGNYVEAFRNQYYVVCMPENEK